MLCAGSLHYMGGWIQSFGDLIEITLMLAWVYLNIGIFHLVSKNKLPFVSLLWRKPNGGNKKTRKHNFILKIRKGWRACMLQIQWKLPLNPDREQKIRAQWRAKHLYCAVIGRGISCYRCMGCILTTCRLLLNCLK